GLGIPKEMQPRVFDEFVRAHPEVAEGTGLGLAIAREAVEQMGGRIWLSSEPGVGTTVCFTVLDPPLAREQAAQKRPQDQRTPYPLRTLLQMLRISATMRY